jgi:DNA-binding PadR family transcriptional regulator
VRFQSAAWPGAASVGMGKRIGYVTCQKWGAGFSPREALASQVLDKLSHYRQTTYKYSAYMPPLKAADLHILLVLAAGPRHGYGIMKEVERESDGKVRLEIGSLYRLLGRMLDDGLIQESGDTEDRRRYYRISRLGRRVLAAEAGRLSALVDLIRVRKLLPPSQA